MKSEILAGLVLAAFLAVPLLAIVAKRRRWQSKDVVANAGLTKVHTDGILPLYAEVAVNTRYLLVQKGTAADGFILNTATTRPWGPVLDEPAVGEKAAVFGLGSATGTVPMVANGAIPAGSLVYTAAAGKVSPTFGATLFMVGRAFTSAAADGDTFEVVPCFPLLNSASL